MKSILKTARYIANRIRLALSALPIQCRYRKKISELKRRRVIRVAFLLSGDTGIQFERLLKLMCDDSLFAPSIVVVPAYGYGVIDPIGRMRAAEESLRKRFGDLVMCSYNGEGFVDIKKHFDICFTTSVYDWQMHANYRIKTMARSGVLVAATSYYFDNGTIHNKIYTIIPALSYLWRFYSTTDNMKKEIQCHHKVLAAFGGVKVSGMPRLDGLVNVPVVERKRKKVLICPHHSVIEQPGLHLSNFLRYSELIQELPTRYPQIDWTFRPHPLLKGVLIKNNIWSESDWDSYRAFI